MTEYERFGCENNQTGMWLSNHSGTNNATLSIIYVIPNSVRSVIVVMGVIHEGKTAEILPIPVESNEKPKAISEFISYK